MLLMPNIRIQYFDRIKDIKSVFDCNFFLNFNLIVVVKGFYQVAERIVPRVCVKMSYVPLQGYSSSASTLDFQWILTTEVIQAQRPGNNNNIATCAAPTTHHPTTPPPHHPPPPHPPPTTPPPVARSQTTQLTGISQEFLHILPGETTRADE